MTSTKFSTYSFNLSLSAFGVTGEIIHLRRGHASTVQYCMLYATHAAKNTTRKCWQLLTWRCVHREAQSTVLRRVRGGRPSERILALRSRNINKRRTTSSSQPVFTRRKNRQVERANTATQTLLPLDCIIKLLGIECTSNIISRTAAATDGSSSNDRTVNK